MRLHGKGIMGTVCETKEKGESEGTALLVPNDVDVKKSVSLLSLWQSKLTLSQFKIIDLYISMINVDDPETRRVTIKKSDIEKLLGVRINFSSLKARLVAVLHSTVSIPKVDKSGQTVEHLINLFEDAVPYKSDNGEVMIDICCTEKGKKFFFNAEQIGYLKYGLRSISQLKSRHAYLLFLYIERNRQLHDSWEESIDRLKKMLGLENEETYRQFKKFNEKILKASQREIMEKTACWYSYEKITENGKVVRIRFVIDPDKRIVGLNPRSISFFDDIIYGDIIDQAIEDQKRIDSLSDPNAFVPEVEAFVPPDYMQPLAKFKIGVANLKEIASALKMFPVTVPWAPEDGKNWEPCYRKYLKLKATMLERHISERKGTKDEIKHVGRYLLRVIMNELNECKSPATDKDKNTGKAKKDTSRMTSAEKYLARYSQREYTEEEMLEIERQMMERSLGIRINRVEQKKTE